MRFRGSVLFFLAIAFDAGGQSVSQPKQDCEALMNAVLPFAEQMLKQHGEFLPYGGAMLPNGEIVSVGGWDGREHPPSADIIKLLQQGFSKAAQSNEYKATALVYDVRVVLPGNGEKSDAVAIALDHRDNYSVVVLLPYRIQNGALSFGAMIAQEGDNKIFLAR